MIVKIINKSNNPLPKVESLGASGVDVYANLESYQRFLPYERHLIPTGLYVEIPQGYEIQVRSRSGWALKKGMVVLNSPGTIDSDYRGEIGVILYNSSNKEVIIQNSDRIAQLVLKRVELFQFQEVSELSKTDRDVKGYGSSGL